MAWVYLCFGGGEVVFVVVGGHNKCDDDGNNGHDDGDEYPRFPAAPVEAAGASFPLGVSPLLVAAFLLVGGLFGGL